MRLEPINTLVPYVVEPISAVVFNKVVVNVEATTIFDAIILENACEDA
jgi:hypothetical protein